MPMGSGGGVNSVGVTLPTGILYSPVSLASRDQDGGPSNSVNDRHLRSHGKIGDCEHSLV